MVMGTNEKRRLTFGWILGVCLVGTMLLGGCASTRYAPRAHWEQDTRGEEDTVLQRLAREIGGSGCILLDGKILYSWGVDRSSGRLGVGIETCVEYTSLLCS